MITQLALTAKKLDSLLKKTQKILNGETVELMLSVNQPVHSLLRKNAHYTFREELKKLSCQHQLKTMPQHLSLVLTTNNTKKNKTLFLTLHAQPIALPHLLNLFMKPSELMKV
jgi:hypothetical protein